MYYCVIEPVYSQGTSGYTLITYDKNEVKEIFNKLKQCAHKLRNTYCEDDGWTFYFCVYYDYKLLYDNSFEFDILDTQFDDIVTTDTYEIITNTDIYPDELINNIGYVYHPHKEIYIKLNEFNI
jgi:hypothetical protein